MCDAQNNPEDEGRITFLNIYFAEQTWQGLNDYPW